MNNIEQQSHWLFIRGLGRHKIHWGDFVDEFKKHLNNETKKTGTADNVSNAMKTLEPMIYQLDLAGNGDQAHRPSFINMDDNVKDLRQRWQKNWISKNPNQPLPKLNLLTISLGSMVGVQWAHLYPEEINNLFTINTSDAGSSAFYQRLRLQNISQIIKLLKSNDPLTKEKLVLDTTTNLLNENEKTLWSQIFAKHPVSNIELLRQLFCASRYKMPKQKPATNIYIINCKKDRLVDAQCSLNISQMWNLKTHTHPTAGHDLPLDDKTWLCTKIYELLNDSQL